MNDDTEFDKNNESPKSKEQLPISLLRDTSLEPVRSVGRSASTAVSNAAHKVGGSAHRAGSAISRFFKRLFTSIALLAIGFVTCFLMMHFGVLPSFWPQDLVEEHTTITDAQLGAIIEPAADLISSRYRYTDAATIDTSKNVLDFFDVPFTRNIEVFTYSGFVGVGFDINDISFDIVDGEDGDLGSITVTLPALEVIENEIDMDSFNYAYQEYSIFNVQTMDHTTNALSELKNRAVERALNDSEFISDARISAETTIRGLLEAAHVGDHYTITIISSDAISNQEE